MEFKNTKKNGKDSNTLTSVENETVENKLDALSDKFDKAQNKEMQTSKMQVDKMSGGDDDKKNYTLYLSKSVINELDNYLKEFGSFGENKSSFIQEAILERLQTKKQNMKKVLLEKLERLDRE